MIDIGAIDIDAIGSELAAGWGLPDFAYHDPGWYDLELRAVFADAWYYVGTTFHVPSVGDTVTGWAGATPVVVVHGRDGDLRAFVNMCRHRGHPVCTESRLGLKALACPYHGWTYGLDGDLRGAPGAGSADELDKAALGLASLRVDTWGNQIFVNCDPHAPDLRRTHPRLEVVAQQRNFDHSADRYRVHRRYDTTAQANWKIWYDNSIECYHCGLVHSETFNAAYEADGAFETLIEDRLISFDFPPRPKADDAELKVSFNNHVHLFPGFLCVQQDDIMIIGQMRPISQSETALSWDVLADVDADPARVEQWATLWWDTFEEDQASIEAVQRNVDSGLPFRNRYVRGKEPVPVAITRWTWEACLRSLEHSPNTQEGHR